MFHRQRSDPAFFTDLFVELDRLQKGFAEVALRAPDIAVERIDGPGPHNLTIQVYGSANRPMLDRFEVLAATTGRVMLLWMPLCISGRTLALASRDDIFLAGMFDMPMRLPQVTVDGQTKHRVMDRAPEVAVTAMELLQESAVDDQAAFGTDPSSAAARVVTTETRMHTRPVTLGYAAKWWFRVHKETLTKLIKAGTKWAEKQSDRLWVFDLDQVSEANPTAATDADACNKAPRLPLAK